MRTRIARAATAVTALLLTGLTAAPAHAEFYSIDDPADATGSLSDITGLEASHGTRRLLVKVRFDDLVRSSAAGVSLFIDTTGTPAARSTSSAAVWATAPTTS